MIDKFFDPLIYGAN